MLLLQLLRCCCHSTFVNELKFNEISHFVVKSAPLARGGKSGGGR